MLFESLLPNDFIDITFYDLYLPTLRYGVKIVLNIFQILFTIGFHNNY